MQVLTEWLYLVSNALLLPVMVALLLMLVLALSLLGGFVREWFDRRHVRRGLRESLLLARQEPAIASQIWECLKRIPFGLPARFSQGVAQDYARRDVVEKALLDVENDVTGAAAKLSFFIRVGPMLGLMGTLIPLGPALTGLASGNVHELATNLIVAFTTTVVGLLISGMAYGMSLVRRIWYGRDMSDLEFLGDRLTRKEA